MDQGMLIDLPAAIDRTSILQRLSQVLDPELDEPILDLGFIRSLRISDGVATVRLDFPTSWCAINFAFMMAEDVRAALSGVGGVQRVVVQVGDHAAADEIEAAVNSDAPFAAAFPNEAGTGLAAVRSTFLRKGFLIRQETVLRELRAAGLSGVAICGLCVGDAEDRHRRVATSPGPLRQYLTRRAELGLDCSPAARLIVDETGREVPEEELEAYYQKVRVARVAAEANGSLCRATLAMRRSASAA
jgi:metal-sulfur cluster biosynthetic enzyme